MYNRRDIKWKESATEMSVEERRLSLILEKNASRHPGTRKWYWIRSDGFFRNTRKITTEKTGCCSCRWFWWYRRTKIPTPALTSSIFFLKIIQGVENLVNKAKLVHNLFLVCILLFPTCFGRLCDHHQEKQLCLCDTRYLLFCMDYCLVCRVCTLHTRQ